LIKELRDKYNVHELELERVKKNNEDKLKQAINLRKSLEA